MHRQYALIMTHGAENLRNAQAFHILLAERLSTFLNSGMYQQHLCVRHKVVPSAAGGSHGIQEQPNFCLHFGWYAGGCDASLLEPD